VKAVIADRQYKKRLGKSAAKRYEADDFHYHKDGNYYTCPHGKRLEYKGTSVLEGHEGRAYRASVTDCRACPLHAECLKSKRDISAIDKGRSLRITESNDVGSLSVELRRKLNTEEYHDRYAHRIQIIEPVFANIVYCKGLNRFTLRGREKVNGQWQLYCIVHNLGKCLKGYNMKKGYA
jgi:hypothetical protein